MSRSRKILVIDDSEVVLEATKAALSAGGFEVITRDTPFGSGAAILREQPDLVLVDFDMPCLSGEDVVRHVREHPAIERTCIVFFSDRNQDELRAVAGRTGADGWITKTDAMGGALAARVSALLEQRRRNP